VSDPTGRSLPTGMTLQIRASIDAIGVVLRNRDIGRLEFGWTASVTADWAYVVAVMVTAYQADGALAVGGVGVARMLVATVSAPVVSGLAGQLGPRRLLIAIDAIRLVAIGAAALLLAAGGPSVALLAAVAVEAGAFAAIRPTQSAMLPALARSPAELVTANLASSTGESIGLFLGPALGGVAIALAGPVVTSVLVVAIVGVGLLAIVPIHADRPPLPFARAGTLDAIRLRLLRGARIIAGAPAPRVVVAAFGAQATVRGILTVLVVVAAIDLLGVGESGVGVLNSAIGVGGFAGAVGSVLLVGRSRLAGPFTIALAAWGLPIAVIGLWPAAALAAGALAVVGAANATLDIAGFTLLQRITPNDGRAAVFGLLEGVGGLGVAVGSLIGPLLVVALGVRGALLVTGAVLPLTAALTWRALARADDAAVVPARELALLRSLPMFRPLPLTTLEQVAARMTTVHFDRGEVVIEQGAPGDCFYLVEAGTLEVERDGQRVATLGSPAAVGEIALLRHVPRTATVRATTPTAAFALTGPDFIAAVTSRPESVVAADEVVAERLEQLKRLERP
jgi:predicted MFS family arabinose efflux permease